MTSLTNSNNSKTLLKALPELISDHLSQSINIIPLSHIIL